MGCSAASAPVSLDRTYASGNRGDLELTHEMHQHLVRRALGLREDDAGGPKAHVPSSTPAVVHGVAEGSVPYQLSMLRFTILSLRYWLGRELP